MDENYKEVGVVSRAFDYMQCPSDPIDPAI
jgi:hypothetical protein